jgi:hypothetical protein
MRKTDPPQIRKEFEMAIQIPGTPSAERVKPTREQALRIAERRKAVRRMRNRRLRRAITVVSIAAFIGPFGVIYAQLAAGHDPALSSSANAPAAVQAQPAGGTTSISSTSTQSTQTTQVTSPAPVTTQQS